MDKSGVEQDITRYDPEDLGKNEVAAEDVGHGGMWDVGSCAHPMPREVESNDEAYAKRSVTFFGRFFAARVGGSSC